MTGTPAPSLTLDSRARQLIGVAALCVVIGLSVMPYLMVEVLEHYMVIIPVACAAAAAALYAVSRPLYFGFSLWVWFLVAFVRRVIDYGLGEYVDSNFVMTAPYMVGGIGVLGLWSVLTAEDRGVRQAFTLSMVALAYGAAVGLAVNGADRMAPFALEWLVPMITAGLLLVDWRQYPRYREVVVRTMTLGMGVLSLYGIYQFFVLPPWDRMWMEAAPMISLGKPEPLLVRIFGPLNAPNPYAMTLAVGLLCLFAVNLKEDRTLGLLARFSAIPAMVAILLSGVRASWGAYFVGFFYVMVQTRSRSRWALALYLVLALAASVPLLLLGEVQSDVTERMESLTSLSDDRSLQTRTSYYTQAPTYLLSNPFGLGLGTIYQVDSGILVLLISLGWGGSFLYCLGLGILYWWAWKVAREGGPIRDRFVVVAGGVSIAMLSAIPFGNNFAGVKGVYLWGFLALALAGVRYYHAVEAGLLRPGGLDAERA
jgi:hypothetical protein